MNRDNVTNQDDLDHWLLEAGKMTGQVRPYLKGDTDLNGEVEFADFVVLQLHFGERGVDWTSGDSNGDLAVTFQDFVNLANNFGMISSQKTHVVPVPSGLSLAVIGLCLCCWRNRYR